MKKGLIIAACAFSILCVTFPAYPSDRQQAESSREKMAASMQGGDFRQAIMTGIEAEGLFNKEGLISKRVTTLVSLSAAYQSLGHYKKALETARSAVDAAVKTGDKGLISSAMARLGNIYLLVNQLDEAEEALKEAYQIAASEGFTETQASILNDTGNLYSLKKKYREATAKYNEALSLSEKTGNNALSARILANISGAYLETANFKEAESALDSACRKSLLLADSHDKAYTFINIAQLFRRLGTASAGQRSHFAARSLKALQDSLSTAGAVHDPLAAAYALGYIGQHYEDAGNYGEALSFTRRALFEAQSSQAPESLYLWQWQSGRVFRLEGKTADAIPAYRGAVTSLQSIRQEFFGDCRIYNQLSFQDIIEPVYMGLVDLLLRGAETEKDREAAEAHLVEAIQTLELLKSAELQDYFQNTCVAASRPRIMKEDITSPDTAIVYFVPFPDRMEMLVGLPNGIRQYKMSITKDALTQEIRLFRQRLEKRTTREYLIHAQKLYEWLIRPYEAELLSQKIDTIVFVPEGPLRTIPLSALHDGKGYLISGFSVATIPGLGLTDAQQRKREKMRVLLTGLSEPVQGFPGLDYVPAELETIRKLYPSRLLINPDFRISEMKREFQETPYSIVHIASHGEFSENSLETYLLTWDERLSMDNIEQFINIGKFRRRPVELLTLSACQSAAGNDRAALGLAGLSVKAGARSALATLWYINDQASADLVSEFYRQLLPESSSKAKALQQAQIKLLSDNRYQHPGYWAPFLLVGNWL
ncbi:MAG: CHAT domain-containing protein [Nitrospirae bacterium]|nr:CHAT domain-containing protein [Nitrospirota bacterium]